MEDQRLKTKAKSILSQPILEFTLRITDPWVTKHGESCERNSYQCIVVFCIGVNTEVSASGSLFLSTSF